MEIKIANERDMKAVFALRFEVFVDEQHVSPEIELDEEDTHACHILAQEQGVAVGCARVIFSEEDAHIGRLAVKKSFRSKGIGSAICQFILSECRKRGYTYIWLNAQLQAAPFYEKLGFRAKGDHFMEAGIEHVQMVLDYQNR